MCQQPSAYGADHGLIANGLARTLPLVSSVHTLGGSSYGAAGSYDVVKVEEDGYLVRPS